MHQTQRDPAFRLYDDSMDRVLAAKVAKSNIEARKASRADKTEHIPWHPDASRVEPADEEEITFRHSGWKKHRDRVREVLTKTGTGPHQMEAFEHCGSGMHVMYSPSLKRWKLAANYCHSRHCVPCAKAKAAKIAANMQAQMARRKNAKFRFVTLTLRHVNMPLADQLRRLYASFGKLRKMGIWKRSQTGGVATLEVKWSPTTRLWHPHLHVITEGNFIDQRDLSEAWLKITGDSNIVDVRSINKDRDVAWYLAKYITKGTSPEAWADDDAAQEWVIATKGVRVAATFGSWRGVKLMEKPADPKDWRDHGRLVNIVRSARAGEIWAIAMLRNIKHAEFRAEKEETHYFGPDGG
jgi:Replication protein